MMVACRRCMCDCCSSGSSGQVVVDVGDCATAILNILKAASDREKKVGGHL